MDRLLSVKTSSQLVEAEEPEELEELEEPEETCEIITTQDDEDE